MTRALVSGLDVAAHRDAFDLDLRLAIVVHKVMSSHVIPSDVYRVFLGVPVISRITSYLSRLEAKFSYALRRTREHIVVLRSAPHVEVLGLVRDQYQVLGTDIEERGLHRLLRG